MEYFLEIISNGDYLNSFTKKYTLGHSCWPLNTKFDDFWTCITGRAFTLPIRLKRVDFRKYIFGNFSFLTVALTHQWVVYSGSLGSY